MTSVFPPFTGSLTSSQLPRSAISLRSISGLPSRLLTTTSSRPSLSTQRPQNSQNKTGFSAGSAVSALIVVGCRWKGGSADVEADKFVEVAVALVLHLLLDADLRRVISLHDPGLQPGEEDLFRLLRVILRLRHARQNRKPLVRRRLHERLAGGLVRQLLDQPQAFAPICPVLRVPGFRQACIDVRRHLRRASARRMIVGRNHQFAQLVERGELVRGEKLLSRGGLSIWLCIQRLADTNRSGDSCSRSKLDHLAPGRIVIRVV